jgi:hypothetical protein
LKRSGFFSFVKGEHIKIHMHNPIQLIEIRPREGFTRCSPLRRGVLLTALMLASFALSPMAQAQSENTATGFEALFSNTTGDFNTATGYQALWVNTPATATRPSVGSLSRTVSPLPISRGTRPSVLKRSTAIPPVISTRQSVTQQCISTPPGPRTPPSV